MQVINTIYCLNGERIQKVGLIREVNARSLARQRSYDRDRRQELVAVYRKRVEDGLALFEDKEIHISDRLDEYSPQRWKRILSEAA